MADRVLVLTGPTAVGKTDLSLGMAEALDGEIISADSRQVYRGMDIGTAKPTAAERARVRHHGLDLVDPDERYSAGRFARDARRWIEEIRSRGRVPLVVGGTGFFIRALTDPMFREPEMDPARRERLKEWLGGLDDDRLREWLARLDPASATALRERGGTQRLLRALEVALLTGRPLGWWQRHRPATVEPVEGPILVLERPRDVLYARIDRRVDRMLEAGLVDEVADLLRRGYAADLPGMTATGYAEIAAHLRGETSLEEAADRIRRRTRRYARRQLTWFRNQLPARAIRLDAGRPVDELVNEGTKRWQTA
jgi:tRNA dimethylallyltransferase